MSGFYFCDSNPSVNRAEILGLGFRCFSQIAMLLFLLIFLPPFLLLFLVIQGTNLERKEKIKALFGTFSFFIA
jgi:hypothetical protein